MIVIIAIVVVKINTYFRKCVTIGTELSEMNFGRRNNKVHMN